MEKFKYILIKSAVVLVIMLALVGIYLSFTSFTNLIDYCNGFFSIGLICVLVGGLAWVSSVGGFDGIGYSTYYVFVGTRAKSIEERKYKNYADYMKQKEQERRGKFYTITPYFIIGGILLIVSVILLLNM